MLWPENHSKGSYISVSPLPLWSWYASHWWTSFYGGASWWESESWRMFTVSAILVTYWVLVATAWHHQLLDAVLPGDSFVNMSFYSLLENPWVAMWRVAYSTQTSVAPCCMQLIPGPWISYDACHKLCRNGTAMVWWTFGVRPSDEPNMEELQKLGLEDLPIYTHSQT